MIIRSLISLAVCATSLFAQNANITTRIQTISLDTTIENVFFQSGGKVQPLQAERSGFAAPVDYVGPRKFVVHASAEAFSAPPPGPVPLAATMLPERASLVLLVVSHTSLQELRLTAYDISPSGFKAGDYRFFNFSPQIVSVIIDKQKFALTPSSDHIASDDAWHSGVLDVQIRLAEVEEGKPRQIYASMWGHQPGKRNFVFLFNGNHPTRPVAIRRLADFAE